MLRSNLDQLIPHSCHRRLFLILRARLKAYWVVMEEVRSREGLLCEHHLMQVGRPFPYSASHLVPNIKFRSRPVPKHWMQHLRPWWWNEQHWFPCRLRLRLQRRCQRKESATVVSDHFSRISQNQDLDWRGVHLLTGISTDPIQQKDHRPKVTDRYELDSHGPCPGKLEAAADQRPSSPCRHYRRRP